MNFSKDPQVNWKYVLIIVVLAAIVGGGIWIYFGDVVKNIISLSQFPEIKKPEEITQDETTDWKTYRSEQYKVEFKYPPDFIFDENCPGGLDNPAVIKSEFVGCDIGCKPHGISFIFKMGPYANIYEAINSIPVSVSGDIGPVESLIFNSNKFTRVQMIEYYGPGDIFYLIQYPKSNLFLSIVVIPTPRTNPETMTIIDYEQITRQILSTFRFIE
ncbi:MAG: hypothetical protein ACKKMS_01435 [Candidatus Nealsonbacteria bacterium]